MVDFLYGENKFFSIEKIAVSYTHLDVYKRQTIDLNGLWISDSYSKGRSGKIMRELELKHGLEVMEKEIASYKRKFINGTLGKK